MNPQSDKDILTDSLLALVMSGLSVTEAAIRLDINIYTARNWLSENDRYLAYRRSKSEEYRKRLQEEGKWRDRKHEDYSLAEQLFISAITLDDVEFFKTIVNVGEKVCCDINSAGYREFCIIEKKYPHFAKTDQGGIPWTWLTIMNRGRIGK